MKGKHQRILFFDGVCSLCNASVDILMRQDPSGPLKFASLQSDLADEYLRSFNLDPKALESLIYYREGQTYTHSDAAIRVFGDIGGWRKIIFILLVIPKFIRNPIYKWIAKNRYRWFGKKETCRMPTPEERDRLIA
jgi:predicted DCC family thiol-disulfide oxidoreductase YuxK